MNDDFDETSEPELTDDEEALLEEMPALTGVGQTRRTFLAGSLGFFALNLLSLEKALAALSPSPDAVFAAGASAGTARRGRSAPPSHCSKRRAPHPPELPAPDSSHQEPDPEVLDRLAALPEVLSARSVDPGL